MLESRSSEPGSVWRPERKYLKSIDELDLIVLYMLSKLLSGAVSEAPAEGGSLQVEGQCYIKGGRIGILYVGGGEVLEAWSRGPGVETKAVGGQAHGVSTLAVQTAGTVGVGGPGGGEGMPPGVGEQEREQEAGGHHQGDQSQGGQVLLGHRQGRHKLQFKFTSEIIGKPGSEKDTNQILLNIMV